MTRISSRRGLAPSQVAFLLLGAAGFLLVLASGWGGAEAVSARRLGAVAFMMACWWVGEAIPLAATALLPIALFPLLGILPAPETCAQYGHHLIQLFLAGFLLARALSAWKLDTRLALFVVAIVGNNPRLIVLGMMLVTAFLSMWVSNSATAAMMMPVGMAVVAYSATLLERDQPGVDTRPGHFRFGIAVMLGIAYSASIGGVGTLVGTPPNVLLAGMLEELAGVRISFAQWMLVGVPVVLLALPLVWAWLVFWAQPPEVRRLPGGRDLVRKELALLGPVGPGGWLTTAIVALTALGWLTRPIWEQLVAPGGFVKDASVGMLGAVLLFLVPSFEEPGRRLLDRSCWKHIPWNVLLLFGGGLALARAFVSTGLDEILGRGVLGMSSIPLPVFIFVITLVVILLTEFASNTASTAMILPLLAASAIALSVPAPLLMVPAALAASMAFMMPAGTPPNAIVFGSGYVSLPAMIRSGIGANLIALLVIEGICLSIVAWIWGGAGS